ncbi:MAG: FkbM family methyltransferase [Pseudomonadota bacterium]
MFDITNRRKARLMARLFERVGATIGFADVGSGGPLKLPWSLLPAAQLRKFDFEPVGEQGGALLCISNRIGHALFYVARDERGSSFHVPLGDFVQRFAMHSLLTARTIEVQCTTLDEFFAGRFGEVDAMDVNIEGHDLQALQGAERLLREGLIKLIKVEFETAHVWQGQGWLSDIDPLMRANGYVLADIEFDYLRPANARGLYHRGEPLWGKAIYVPGANRWNEAAARLRATHTALEEMLARGIALYLAADMPGHALDVLDLGVCMDSFTRIDATALRAEVAQAYRWAKVEYGVDQFVALVRRAIGSAGVSANA